MRREPDYGSPDKEKNNHLEGRSGAETMQKPGPAAGKKAGNPISNGKIRLGK